MELIRCDPELRQKMAEWPQGPWLQEPDRVEWVDGYTGFTCMVLRNLVGALCGYVGVRPGHPWHGVQYNGCLLPEAVILTEEMIRERHREGREMSRNDEERAIFSESIEELMVKMEVGKQECSLGTACTHTPESRVRVHGGLTFSGLSQGRVSLDEPDPELWWFGFDCAHSDDLAPGLMLDFNAAETPWRGTYRNLEYVGDAVLELARQIKDGETDESLYTNP